MIIAVDFDGTCVTHEFPKIGKDIGAIPVLKKLIKKGHRLILWTMRSSGQENKKVLDDAFNWFLHNDIPLFGVNTNPEQYWSRSPKAYAELYIDDAALGCPLKFDPLISNRHFVDWSKVEQILIDQDII